MVFLDRVIPDSGVTTPFRLVMSSQEGLELLFTQEEISQFEANQRLDILPKHSAEFLENSLLRLVGATTVSEMRAHLGALSIELRRMIYFVLRGMGRSLGRALSN